MLNTYTTIAGDTWDIVAYKALGNEMYKDKVMKQNLEHMETLIFSAGTVLQIPEIEFEASETLPPWKRGVSTNE